MSDDIDVLELISDSIEGFESWAEGKTLTVMMGGPSARRFVKLRLVKIADKPSVADMRGAPE